MRIDRLELDARSCRLALSECTEAKVNALRRTLLSDLPSIAADSVRVFANTSCFPDEYVAHRIGLMPLRGALREATLRVECTGPCRVLGRDLSSPDGSVVVMAPDSLVVELQEGERFVADVHVAVGTGAAHSRWCSAVAVRYSQRSKGFSPPGGAEEGGVAGECFCDDVAFGERCPHCGARKRELRLRDAPLLFELEFETTGALTLAEMLVGAFDSVMRDLRTVRASCQGKLQELPVDRRTGPPMDTPMDVVG